MLLDNVVWQPKGFKAFISGIFPPRDAFSFAPEVQLADAQAALALGKLDGVAQLVPDIDVFTFMYVRKEALLSSNIEGTKATMSDSLKADIQIIKDTI